MIKKIIEISWYEKEFVRGQHSTLKKNFLRLKQYGLKETLKQLDEDYKQLNENLVAKSRIKSKFSTLKMRWLFFSIFIMISSYYLAIKSELYESKTAFIVKSITQPSSASSLGLSLLGVGNSSQLQDSMVVEEYLRSLDMYKEVDKQFQLSKHYKSDALDFIERLPKDATQEDILKMYNEHLLIFYDEKSGILHVSFLHVNPQKAHDILQFLVTRVDYQINEFNRRRAKKELKFVQNEFIKAKQKMEQAIKNLEAYQNKHLLLDPSAEAVSKSSIIAELEGQLSQKKLEYATKKRYLNDDNFELILLQNQIKEIKKSIQNVKKRLTGKEKGKLNQVVFKYEQLKMQLKFATEVYKNTLLQLETTKIEVSKNDKTLSIVSQPNIPDGYTYPNKPKVFITIFILTLLFYGIVSMLITIIKDHKE
ncbi:Capsular polysaccharide export system inner membrane protein KpsE [hydrothermal vent metagenome]|uniref:Capsular polysaccharide export system inner membrane protein KpsE n=1 Tax=hydrothermal vent metagenome TaxID=652676 RepID=A0A1W1D547_9ZZZZ